MKLIANTQTDHHNAKLTFRLTDIVTYIYSYNYISTLTRLDTTTIAIIMHLQGQSTSKKLVVLRQTDRRCDL